LKEEIRKKIINLRKNFKNSEEHSKLIADRFFSLPETQKARTFLFYYPHKNEVNTIPIIEKLMEQNKAILLPKVEKDRILPIFISNLSELKEGFAGIKEPSGEEYPKEKIDIVVVPAVAFDRKGYRIGYGKGYYDRFLSDYKGLKIGLAYQFQLMEKLPHEEHDVPVDIVITPFEIIRVKEEKNG
jgi:5-formyltetrahydrofolate cyclo-ligase